ncbi:hypothetical protein Hanom_Chr00s000005g01612171 [Helianthus anomalus]
MTGYKKVGVLMNQFKRKALKVCLFFHLHNKTHKFQCSSLTLVCDFVKLVVDFLSNEDVLKTLNCYFVV